MRENLQKIQISHQSRHEAYLLVNDHTFPIHTLFCNLATSQVMEEKSICVQNVSFFLTTLDKGAAIYFVETTLRHDH